MKTHHLIGILTLAVGLAIIFLPRLFKVCDQKGDAALSDTAAIIWPPQPATGLSGGPINPSPVKTTTITVGGFQPTNVALPAGKAPTSMADYFADRAMREATAAAQRATESFKKEILAPVEADDKRFADALYGGLIAKHKSTFKSEKKYQEYVAKHFYEELNRYVAVETNLEAIAIEYLHALDRIAQMTILEAGCETTGLPQLSISLNDLDRLVRSETYEVVKGVSATDVPP